MEKYDVVKVVGKGSFGKAILVTRKIDNFKCIIKEISIAKLGKKEVLATQQEALLLSRLNHPNIVTFIESFQSTSKSTFFIVMEFADKGDLDKLIKSRKGRNFLEVEVTHLFIQIALAIKHIHDRKILHRDLKSENIFLG